MRDTSDKNQKRFPPVKIGDRIRVVNAKIPVLNDQVGVIIDAPQTERSPYKAIYKVEISGRLSRMNPWYVFRTEFKQLNPKGPGYERQD